MGAFIVESYFFRTKAFYEMCWQGLRLKVQYIDKIDYPAIKEKADYNVETGLVSATEIKKLLKSDLRVSGSNHSIADRPIKTR